MLVRRILAIDPGKMTGMSCFTWSPGTEPVLLWSGEVEEHEYAVAIRHELSLYPETEIVCERFIINAQTAKKSQAPYSLELIGALKLIVRDYGRTSDSFKFQSPADAMNLFPNPALKKLGYWHVGGAGHALDSIRHGLLYLATSGWPPARLLD